MSKRNTKQRVEYEEPVRKQIELVGKNL